MSHNKRSSFKVHYAWVILLAATLILAVYAPIVNSLSNTWQIAVTQDLGFSRSQFSLNTTIVQAVGIFVGPMVSKILLKHHFKRVWLGFAFLFTLGVFGYGLCQNPWQFYLCSFVIGFAYITTTAIPITMMINNWFDHQRGLATSIAFAGVSAGGFILSPMVTYLINHVSWRWAYFSYAGLIAIIALLCGGFLMRSKPADLGLRPYGAEDPTIPSDQGRQALDTQSLNLDISAGQSWQLAFFLLLMLGSILNGVVNGASLQFPPALQEAQPLQFASVIVSAYLLIGIFGKLLMGWISDRFGLFVSLILGVSAMTLAFFAMLFAGTSWGPWMLAICFGLGLSMGTVVLPIVTASIYSKKAYGEAFGFLQSAFQIGTAIGPLIVAGSYDLTQSYQIAWYIMIVISILVGVAWLWGYHHAKQTQSY
ncbi:hypothetical protein HMPREF2758_03620 [Facklamia sp. HMSC062C11]|uniref:MFS transporter n=1 Tax=Facklamia sp. HMSC062C11 TaxID=1739262 RepID=UPI0008A2FEB1|nr:MFS transporter [Facklamia sp. HMSC062C11]OFL64520.1 hypothetical protein HMPREF2758_03620 [Facklamia sp. HMSC062C11]